MPKRQKKSLPTEFEAAIERWRDADVDVRIALALFRATPNPVNRLAAIMAWAALEVPLGELSGCEHPRVMEAMASVRAMWTQLHTEIDEAGLLVERTGAPD
jgi:hypothetical protein